MTHTIFALSSGQPPAGIAVVRISGPNAGAALSALTGRLPAPRRASYRVLRNANGDVLDQGLVLWFPGANTATGEDLAELHLHGGRAVVAAVLAEVGRLPGLRAAEAGEFTRRAFENGRIDLAQAEGLADLLSAETEGQRRAALMLAEGQLGQLAETWRTQLLTLSALVEADLDLSDEDDVGEGPDNRFLPLLVHLIGALDRHLAAPPAERLRDGVRIVLAGPPNAGKSSLFNALIGRDAAIVTDIAGTTRDRIEAPVMLDGLPLLLIDTAGLHAGTGDAVEAIGMARTHDALAEGDVIVWLGEADAAPVGALHVAAKSDLPAHARFGLAVSVVSGEGLSALRAEITARARALLPQPGTLALHARHRAIVSDMAQALRGCLDTGDALIQAEHLRLACDALDRLTGRSGVEDMLDTLFGTFCVGK